MYCHCMSLWFSHKVLRWSLYLEPNAKLIRDTYNMLEKVLGCGELGRECVHDNLLPAIEWRQGVDKSPAKER